MAEDLYLKTKFLDTILISQKVENCHLLNYLIDEQRVLS